MSRIRFLTVPKNDAGIEEYNTGIEHTENMIESKLGEDEFWKLARLGVFKEFNEKYDLLIDDYESEIIPAEAIRKSYSLIGSVPGEFIRACDKAIEYNTFLALDF